MCAQVCVITPFEEVSDGQTRELLTASSALLENVQNCSRQLARDLYDNLIVCRATCITRRRHCHSTSFECGDRHV